MPMAGLACLPAKAHLQKGALARERPGLQLHRRRERASQGQLYRKQAVLPPRCAYRCPPPPEVHLLMALDRRRNHHGVPVRENILPQKLVMEAMLPRRPPRRREQTGRRQRLRGSHCSWLPQRQGSFWAA
jgi:hypothetical protein